jgi:transketolase
MQGRLDRLTIDTIRTLSMDAVQAALSGHPGTPMALAPVVYSLWHHALRYDPADARWPDRDRFVLSCGHASMLLYAVLHLAGVKNKDGSPAVSLEEIKNFRQLDSKTPGHPEYHWTTGVETTTGPLGQGAATSVGMALAQRWLAARYNKPGFELFTHRVFALCGDGCLMEGVTSEAASLAGHLQLGKLCWIYDNNTITIEGHTDLTFSEDVGAKFRALGWRTAHVTDANDTAALIEAFSQFDRSTDTRPLLLIVDSVIGYGAPNKANTHAAHGEPLGEEEIKAAKRAYGWLEDAKFLVPAGVPEHFGGGLAQKGGALRAAWRELFGRYKQQFPAEGAELEAIFAGELPHNWDASMPVFPADPKGLASRDASGKVLNALGPKLPWLVGGSADLAPSTKTLLTFEGAGHQQAATPAGRNLHFGVREHAMGAVCNGLALSGLRSYGASFLVFTDFARPSIRLSALMELPVTWVFTHDSIGLGEDGPTHQPIEHLASLRAMPNLAVIRPGDANETAEAWRVALNSQHRPTLLALSRQALPTLDRTRLASAAGVARGAYVLADAAGGAPELIVIASGSELAIAFNAYEQLQAEGLRVRLVSMPCWELFEDQPESYREQVFPAHCRARIAIEAGSPFGWERYVGQSGRVLGINSFGASAPAAKLYEKFQLTASAICRVAHEMLATAR